MTPFYAAEGRWVLTYQPDRWPVGIITGYPDGVGGFAVEHVITISGEPGAVGMAMMRAGLEEAWARGFKYVTYHLPNDYPPAGALREVGRRLGFVEQERASLRTSHFVCWREPVPA